MRKIQNILNSKKAKMATYAGLGATVLSPVATTYAINSDTSTIDAFVDFVVSWMVKIGGVVALVGGIMFALAFQREDSEGKTRGLQTIMAGLMAAAIALASKTLFGVGTK